MDGGIWFQPVYFSIEVYVEHFEIHIQDKLIFDVMYRALFDEYILVTWLWGADRE